MALIDWIFPILTFFLFLVIIIFYPILWILWISLFGLIWLIFLGFRKSKRILKALPLVLLLILTIFVSYMYILLLTVVAIAYAPFVIKKKTNRYNYSFTVFFVLLTIFCIITWAIGGIFSGSKQKLSITVQMEDDEKHGN